MPDNKKNKKNLYRQLDKLQRIIKVRFTDKSLLKNALTHSSYVNEVSVKNIKDNERLEYLGDSVLGLVVNEYLYKHYEDYHEGELAKIKSAVVSEYTLAKVAREMNLGSFILMGKGEEHSGGRYRSSILSDTVEAIIGAIYLDAGLKTAKKFILSMMKKHINQVDHTTYLRDPKTTLQEYVQQKYKEQPSYRVINEDGPDHQKIFTIKLFIHGKEFAVATGTSKRKAEINAAKVALLKLHENDGGSNE